MQPKTSGNSLVDRQITSVSILTVTVSDSKIVESVLFSKDSRMLIFFYF